jgi:hypothetical protein
MVIDLAAHHPFQVLNARGWTVEITAARSSLPLPLRSRYPHLPADFAALLGPIDTCHNERNDAWIFGASDFAREDPAAFRWNECEIMSLAAVDGDVAAVNQVRRYWDHHLPFMMAAHSDYDYLAVATSSAVPLGAIVHGSGPEFEDSTIIAPSFAAFLVDLSDAVRSTNPPYPLALFL